MASRFFDVCDVLTGAFDLLRGGGSQSFFLVSRTFRAIHNAAGHKLRPSPVNRFTPGDSGSRATEGGRGSEVKKRKARKGSGGEARTEREQASSKVVSGTGSFGRSWLSRNAIKLTWLWKDAEKRNSRCLINHSHRLWQGLL